MTTILWERPLLYIDSPILRENKITSVLCIMRPSLFYFGALHPEKGFLVNLFIFHLFFSSVIQSCPTLGKPMDCSMPGLPIYHQFLGFKKTHVHWVGNVIQPLILCRPLSLLPSIFPSIRVFSNESVFYIRWPKYWSFSYVILLSKCCRMIRWILMDDRNQHLSLLGLLSQKCQSCASRGLFCKESA